MNFKIRFKLNYRENGYSFPKHSDLKATSFVIFHLLWHVYHVILLQSQQFEVKSITWLYHWVVVFTGIVTTIYTAYLRNETDMDTTVIFPLDSEMEELSKGFDERHAFNVSYGTSKLKWDIVTVSIDKSFSLSLLSLSLFLSSLSLSLSLSLYIYIYIK